jgi:hypothetical protein
MSKAVSSCVDETATELPSRKKKTSLNEKLAQFFDKILSLWSQGRGVNPEGSLSCSQESATRHYRETD